MLRISFSEKVQETILELRICEFAIFSLQGSSCTARNVDINSWVLKKPRKALRRAVQGSVFLAALWLSRMAETALSISWAWLALVCSQECLHLVSTWALLPLQFLLHSTWSALLKWAELGKRLDDHCFHGTVTKIQSGFWRCYYIVTLQIVLDFTRSPVCIEHKSLLPLRIFGTFFVVRSALNIKNKR